MNKKLFSYVLISLFFISNLFADNNIFVIKVNGSYGIINKGANQGMQEGEVLFIKRGGIAETLCKVKVLRVTANRAAVEQVSNKKDVKLLKGDMVYLENELTISQSYEQPKERPVAIAQSYQKRFSKPSKKEYNKNLKNTQQERKIDTGNNSSITGKQSTSTHTRKVVKSESNSYRSFSPMRHFKNPWVTMEVGSIFPNGHFSELYSNSVQVNANYMVSITNDLNIGLDISNSFLNNTDLTSNFESSSMLTVAVLFQKFFGDYFFMEGGGGVFRPKVTLTSVDGVKNSYSQTNFGIVAGGGFYIPTSSYAGFTMKGKLHSYFDHYSKNYFGITGGFRFKIR